MYQALFSFLHGRMRLSFSFYLQQAGNVSLIIFDIEGRIVKNIGDKFFEKGDQQIKFNTNDLKPGVYLLKTRTTNYTVTKKIVVIR